MDTCYGWNPCMPVSLPDDCGQAASQTSGAQTEQGNACNIQNWFWLLAAGVGLMVLIVRTK